MQTDVPRTVEALRQRLVRLPEVKAVTGLSRSTIYLRISQGVFPKPVNLGGRAVGWLEAEVQEWLQRRVELSRKVNVHDKDEIP